MKAEKTEGMKLSIDQVSDMCKELYGEIEDLLIKRETPDIVYISVFARHLCECFVMAGYERDDAMEKLDEIYGLVEASEKELLKMNGGSESIN